MPGGIGDEQRCAVTHEADRVGGVLGCPLGHHGGAFGVEARAPAGIGQHEGPQAIRVAQREAGGDHPTPRHAEHHGPIDPGVVE
tara:strand:- start:50 stop:301 length:252 start_codon:yes stop_codon:yes gene_type:complete